jgi:hypothetical protein
MHWFELISSISYEYKVDAQCAMFPSTKSQRRAHSLIKALRWVTIERAGGAGSHGQEGNEARRGDARGVMVMVRVESGATEEAGEGGLANNRRFFFSELYRVFPSANYVDVDKTLSMLPRGYVDELRWSPAPIFGRMTTPRLWPRGRRLGVGPAETGVSIHTKPWSSG